MANTRNATPSDTTAPYFRIDIGIFIHILNWANKKRIEINKLNHPEWDQNRLDESTNFKIHISLQPADYSKHQDEINKILLRYLIPDSIHQFKYVNEISVMAVLRDQREVPDDFWNRYIRFFDGDQYTIYIPENYDKQIILALCQDLVTYFKQNNIQPGKKTSVASELTPHLNFRRETLNGQYVDPILCTKMETIMTVKLLQESSDIYRYLKKELNPGVQHIFNIFKPGAKLLSQTQNFIEPTTYKPNVTAETSTLEMQPSVYQPK